MSSLALDLPAPARRPVIALVRLQLTNWPIALGFPLGIMSTSFLINVLIFSSIGDAIDQPTTGGLASLYIVQLVVGWQGLYQYFGFAVGLNATRRSFFLSTLLVVLGESVLYSLLLYGLGLIERATGGWGTRLRFFDPLPLTHSGAPVTILVYLVPMFLMGCLAILLGAVTRRWGGNGVFVLTVISIVVLGGAAALITYVEGWPAVLSWFGSRSWLSITAGWLLVPAVLAAAGGALALRRAVP